MTKNKIKEVDTFWKITFITGIELGFVIGLIVMIIIIKIVGLI